MATTTPGPLGYTSPVLTAHRGPWFRSFMIEDDGLQRFYYLNNEQGQKQILLANNMSWKDRESLERLYFGFKRMQGISTLLGGYLGFQMYARCLKKIQSPFRFLGALFIGIGFKYDLEWYLARHYRPLLIAYFRKYNKQVKERQFDLSDRKREWFQIDTSQPMRYTVDDVSSAGYHAHHGPQPDGEVFNNSWIEEMDKYLKGEENNFKQHPNYIDYKFQYTYDRKIPTRDEIDALFTAPECEPRPQRPNLKE